MSGWGAFLGDVQEQMPLILAGLLQSVELTVSVSVTGLLLGIVVF